MFFYASFRNQKEESPWENERRGNTGPTVENSVEPLVRTVVSCWHRTLTCNTVRHPYRSTCKKNSVTTAGSGTTLQPFLSDLRSRSQFVRGVIRSRRPP